MKQIILFYLLCISTNIAFGGVDTVQVYSEAMDQTIPNLVITPKDYTEQNDELPVKVVSAQIYDKCQRPS